MVVLIDAGYAVIMPLVAPCTHAVIWGQDVLQVGVRDRCPLLLELLVAPLFALWGF